MTARVFFHPGTREEEARVREPDQPDLEPARVREEEGGGAQTKRGEVRANGSGELIDMSSLIIGLTNLLWLSG